MYMKLAIKTASTMDSEIAFVLGGFCEIQLRITGFGEQIPIILC